QLDHMLCLDGFLVIEVMVFAVLTGCEEKLHGKKDGCMGKLAAWAALSDPISNYLPFTLEEYPAQPDCKNVERPHRSFD
ncbi:MAG: hypothetical protein OEY01_16480, partial [Desulfobulbaceae bacterium]|nr:hypothetical protein [Desulfobulbaceae bacterium]